MSMNRHPNECPTCEQIPCKCVGGVGAHEDKLEMDGKINVDMKYAAIEILIFRPNPKEPLPAEQRGVVVNPRLKERFKQVLHIGVYLEGSSLKYYLFEQCDNTPQLYNSLSELKNALPSSLSKVFESSPKLFIMGHGNGGTYGLCNIHGLSEQLYLDNFDRLIKDFKAAISEKHGEVFVTLEACNVDSQADAQAKGEKITFLQRLSANYTGVIFGGSAPWAPQDQETGFSGISPAVAATSIVGGVWKPGNSVIFYYGQYQIAATKRLFSSTATTRALKINTVEYARALLEQVAISETILHQIALRRDIVTIQDLRRVLDIPMLQSSKKESLFLEAESRLLEKDKARYLAKVASILMRAGRSIQQVTGRDILELTLGLREPTIFEGAEHLQKSVLADRDLLQLVMVSCGKVLMAGPSNDDIIDLLLVHNININSTDEKGMTALHYAALSFYNYRAEPIALVRKLLDCGANITLRDKQGATPVDVAHTHCKDERVKKGDALLVILKSGQCTQTLSAQKEDVNKIFQMSKELAESLLSLPSDERIYMSHVAKGHCTFQMM
jgi:hypothetical protein